jgi:type I restriction enzyme, S subunit
MSEQKGLPQGWAWTTVAEIAKTIQYGHTASASDTPNGPRFLRITDIQDGLVAWESVPSCEISLDERSKYRLDSGDIVFARTGATTGKSFLIRQCPDAVFASYLIRLRMFPGIFPTFVHAYFQTNDYWRQIEGGKRGIGQPNVNASILGRIHLPLAPANEQRRIVAKV